MAAEQSGGNSTGRTIYYPISYGMLSTKEKEPLEGAEEISAEDLKAKTMAVENIDLRNRYVKKDGDYPYQNFYSSISGTILSVEKDKYDKGTSLKVTIQDTDGDQSVLQVAFYGKVSADFLNRLSSLKTLEGVLAFSPYSIPSKFTTSDGKEIEFYQSGVSIKRNGEKVVRGYKKDEGLPDSERVQDANGNDVTSRVKQINWLWEKVLEIPIVAPTAQAKQAPKANDMPDTGGNKNEPDDLPF